MNKAKRVTRGVVWFVAGVVYLVGASPLRAQPQTAPAHTLKLTTLGNPVADKPEAARKINDLFLHDSRLYIGSGDATANTGATDVICYDPVKRGFVTEFKVDEEAILRFRELDGRLVIPGTDATEDWDLGNVYVREKGKWTKHRSLPNAVHVLDAASFGGAWYAAAAIMTPLTDGQEIGCGALFVSRDHGASWQIQHTSPGSLTATYRFAHLAVASGRLLVFPYAHGAVGKEALPAEFAGKLKEPLTNRGKPFYLVFMGDPLGGPDAISVGRDGGWQLADLIPTRNAFVLGVATLGDTAILNVATGQPILAPRHYNAVKDGLPPGHAAEIWTVNAEGSRKLDLPGALVRDMVGRGDTLTMLVIKERAFWIVETRDTKTWTWHRLPKMEVQPTALERAGEDFYLGLTDGTIVKASQ
jgi:hypothetical protein